MTERDLGTDPDILEHALQDPSFSVEEAARAYGEGFWQTLGRGMGLEPESVKKLFELAGRPHEDQEDSLENVR